MKRQVPKMTTDEEVEAFLASDLSDIDFSQFKPTRFRFSASHSPKKKAASGRRPLVASTRSDHSKGHK
jgi:predicted DNA binding CopG/RHH family protein